MKGGLMKKSVFPVLVAAVLSVLLVTVVMAAESGKMETATGKVTSIDPQGKGITISAKMGGKEAMDVGTVVDKDTIVKVKGKKATLNDIKVGDTITIRFLRSNDLYAKEIMKK
jgi:Cu/Ag efflux protein CusF